MFKKFSFQAIFRGTFNQQASLTLIVLALERYWATVHPLTFEGFCSKQVRSLEYLHTDLFVKVRVPHASRDHLHELFRVVQVGVFLPI